MADCITLYASNNDVAALIQLGLKLGRSPGWIDLDLHDDHVNELVEITLEFASKEDAVSFSEDFTGCLPSGLAEQEPTGFWPGVDRPLID